MLTTFVAPGSSETISSVPCVDPSLADIDFATSPKFIITISIFVSPDTTEPLVSPFANDPIIITTFLLPHTVLYRVVSDQAIILHFGFIDYKALGEIPYDQLVSLYPKRLFRHSRRSNDHSYEVGYLPTGHKRK